jgi:hypothetical protein
MKTTRRLHLVLACIVACGPVLAHAGPARAASAVAEGISQSRGVETLRESGTNTQPYTRVAPSGDSVHYYVPNGNNNPYTSQPEGRVGPPVGFGPNTQGNWYGNMGGTGFPSQKGLDLYEKQQRQ